MVYGSILNYQNDPEPPVVEVQNAVFHLFFFGITDNLLYLLAVQADDVPSLVM